MWPYASIVMPTRNARLAATCLKSLGKTEYPEYEVLIVVDEWDTATKIALTEAGQEEKSTSSKQTNLLSLCKRTGRRNRSCPVSYP
jgi:hypothetical protein